MALTASITTNSTTATKMVDCGTYTFDATGSTLGTGRADQHRCFWEITSAPDGFMYQTTDPRPGAFNGNTVDMTQGKAVGWYFQFPLTHEGDYTVRLTITDEAGTTDTDTVMVSVAAFAGDTIYCDADAVGADDGTSWTDAYDSITDALVAAEAIGSDVRVIVRGGKTYVPSAQTSLTGSNVCIKAEDPATKYTVDYQGTGLLNFRGENCTYRDFNVTNSTGDATSLRVIPITNGVADFYEYNGSIDPASGNLRSNIELTTTTSTRILIHDCDFSRGTYRYPVIFATGQIMLVGVAGDNNSGDLERPIRVNDDGSGIGSLTMLYCDMQADYKDPVRLHEGAYHCVVNNNIMSNGGSYGIRIDSDQGGNGNTSYVRVEGNYVYSSGNSGIWWQDVTTSNDTFNTITIEGNVIELSGVAAAERCVWLDDGCYAATVRNNTFISSNRKLMWDKSTNSKEIYGNFGQYNGASDSGNMFIIVPGSSSTDVQYNILDKGALTNDNIWNDGSADYTTTNYNAESYAANNSEDTVVLDSNYEPDSIGTYTGDGLSDYYGNSLTGTVSVGAVDSVPTAPTVANLTPADDATGLADSVTFSMQFSENMSIMDAGADIELRYVSNDAVIDTITLGDVTINISNRTQVTLSGLAATGLTGGVAAYVYFPNNAIMASATGLPFAGYTNNTDWNMTFGSAGGGGGPAKSPVNVPLTHIIRKRRNQQHYPR